MAGLIDVRSELPPRAMRIGVTGTRKLRASQVLRIKDCLHTVLHCIAIETNLHGPPPPDFDPGRQPPREEGRNSCRFLSALARGADRYAAEQAHALGYKLSVAMPFQRADYILDFQGREDESEPPLTAKEDLAEFNNLLAEAGDRWLALDGGRADEPDRAYEAVGRFIARHSDLLIAVWDGGAARGRGGTADIIRYATNLGIPVWWIHATEDRPAAWIVDHHDIHANHAEGAAEAQLRAYIANLLTEPVLPRSQHHHWIRRLARIGQSKEAQPLSAFLGENVPPTRRIWRIYGHFMRLVSGLKATALPACRPNRADAEYWFDRYAPADARATAYASRYRSSYVWILVFGAIAVICGALPPLLSVFRPEIAAVRVATVGEAVALLMIVIVVGAAMRHGWHERFIEFRLLAELCRTQQALTYVGWTVANGRVRRIASQQRLSWVAWLFASYQRAAPLPKGDIASGLHTEAHQAIRDLVVQQLEYYESRARVAEAAQRHFSLLGTLCFGGLWLCVLLRLAETWYASMPVTSAIIGLFGTLLPGLSAAFAGIGAYAELQILADQSRHMVAELHIAKSRLERFEDGGVTRPLFSQELGNEAAAISTFMLQELDGWAALFRAKVIETG